MNVSSSPWYDLIVLNGFTSLPYPCRVHIYYKSQNWEWNFIFPTLKFVENIFKAVFITKCYSKVSSVFSHKQHPSLISRPSTVSCFLNLQSPMMNPVNWRRFFLVCSERALDLFSSKFPRRLALPALALAIFFRVFLSCLFHPCERYGGINGLHFHRRTPVPIKNLLPILYVLDHL